MNPESAAHILPSTRMQDEDAELADHAVAPRVSLDRIIGRIAEKSFTRIGSGGVNPDGLLTVCTLQMVNGFFITGQAAPASPENFDSTIGESLAYEDALRQAFRFEGYLLRDKLWRESQASKVGEAFPGSETIAEVDGDWPDASEGQDAAG